MKHEPASSRVLAALGLRQPLRQLTRPRLDERRVQALWQGIEQRSWGSYGATSGQQRRPGWLRAWLSPATLGVALALTLLLAIGWSLRSTSPAPAEGPLLTAAGQRFESVEAQQAAEHISFADGSAIEAAPGTRIEGLAATASEFVVLLRRGRARFSVTPGGPRRWLVEARGARVEVVGTVFSVESGGGAFAVRVETGVVLVRSPLLADGVQRVGAGQALRLAVEGEAAEGEAAEGETAAGQSPAAPAAPAPEVAAVEAAASASQGSPERVRARQSSASNSAREMAALPEPQLERTAPRSARDRPAPVSAVELWAQADAARRAGAAAKAAERLQRLIEEYPGDSQAGLAAYTLGVLQLEQLAAPRAAAQRFRQALQLGIAAGLRESCYLRQAEALRHAGDDAAARQVARQYLRSFPLGEHRNAMQRWITAPESFEGTRDGQKGRGR